MALNGFTILVAEDEPDQMAFISTILEDQGVKVVKAQNGHQALEAARTGKPDAMTLDITMPGMDVMQVVAEVKNDPSLQDLKICIISGRPELRLVLQDRHLNGNAYIDKPFTESQLVDTLHELLTS